METNSTAEAHHSPDKLVTFRAVATGGISGYIPPKSVYLKFFKWLFCLLAMTS